MSNEFQNSSKTPNNRLLTIEEKELFGLLEKGACLYSKICQNLQCKKISKSTVNRLLKKNVKKNRLFRIEKAKNVYYTLNKFPLNVNLILTLIDAEIKDKEKKIIETDKDEITLDILSDSYKLQFEKLLLQLFQKNQLVRELNEFQTLKNNLILFYPKLNLSQIIQLTLAEIGAETIDDKFSTDVIRKFKESLV